MKILNNDIYRAQAKQRCGREKMIVIGIDFGKTVFRSGGEVKRVGGAEIAGLVLDGSHRASLSSDRAMVESVPSLNAPAFIMVSYSGRSFRFAHLDGPTLLVGVDFSAAAGIPCLKREYL